MGAIPRSDLPGQKRLDERVQYALDRCQELQDVEFKESATWEILQWKIIKASLGMGNLRDGGIVVIGASSRGGSWALTGVLPEHLATFDVDKMTDQVNAYVSPHVDLDIVVVPYRNGKEFLAIQVNEFVDTPLVCKKNGPDTIKGTSEELAKGIVYVRPVGVPRTTRITEAGQMHDLLELAAEKRARRLLESATRIGLVPSAATVNPFDNELGGL